MESLSPQKAAVLYVDVLQELNHLLHTTDMTMEEYNDRVSSISTDFRKYLETKGLV